MKTGLVIMAAILALVCSASAQIAPSQTEAYDKALALPYSLSSEVIAKQTEIRWYFNVTPSMAGQGSHISFFSVDGTILDKRFEQLTWFPGMHYVSRTLDAGMPVIKWSGPLKLVSVVTVAYSTSSWEVEIPDYDCSMVVKEEDSCKLLGYHKEARSRTDEVLTPLKAVADADLSKATRLDACLSTDVNISAGSVVFQLPTAANNSYTTNNWTLINTSITTDNLNTFGVSWLGPTGTGTNYSIYDDSLVLALNFNNNTAIGENATVAKDSSKNNYTAMFYNGTTACGNDADISCPQWISGGRYNFGINYDGINDYSKSPNAAIGRNFSILIWINLHNNSAGSILSQFYDSNNRWRLYLSALRPSWTVKNGTPGNSTTWATNLVLNKWTQLGIVFTPDYNTTMYINGVQDAVFNGAIINFTQYGNIFLGSFDGTTGYINASLDEVRVYNRSLSAAEIAFHFQSEIARYNSTEYRFYANVTGLANGTYSYYGYANDSAGNPGTTGVRYLNVGAVPGVSFVSQTPADITSTTMFQSRANITYKIQQGLYPIANATALLYYKVNNSDTDCLRIINGTTNCGYRELAYSSAQDTNYSWDVGDAKVYPYTENLDFQAYFRNVNHNFTTLTAANQYISVEILNVSKNKTYGFFEININTTLPITSPLYVCNSSYAHAGSPTGSPYCVIFGSIPNTQTFNHTHNASIENSSNHHVIPFTENITTGTVNGLGITDTMYFLVRGQAARTIYVGEVGTISRTTAIKKSANNGITWTNQAFTVDAHLHQFNQADQVVYYACANDTNGYQNCSAEKIDLLQLGGLPPQPPYVYSPTNGTYLVNASMSINYTRAVSPNGYPITFYNISLYNESFSFLVNLNPNATTNLSWTWDSNYVPGNYSIGVTAWDNMSQSSTGYSEIFQLDYTTTTTTSTTTTTAGTTTTTGATTTTTRPPAVPSNNGILWIYSIMIPTMALIVSLASFHLPKQPLPAFIAAIFWFVSTLTTANILFVEDFTVSADTTYAALGNPEISSLFLGLAIIMALWGIFIALTQASDMGWFQRKEREGYGK
jgi:hypothetical protein